VLARKTARAVLAVQATQLARQANLLLSVDMSVMINCCLVPSVVVLFGAMNVDIVEPQTMCDLRSPRIATDYYTVLMRREQSGRAAQVVGQ
jgi:hypothetical protein